MILTPSPDYSMGAILNFFKIREDIRNSKVIPVPTPPAICTYIIRGIILPIVLADYRGAGDQARELL
jgi:hypothetical protein